ncbi:MAG: DUF1566 domain-containing protein [Burkholderiales bacterium]|nr:DUF1566 domain-containing protein [Burkholderiales bacterium]
MKSIKACAVFGAMAIMAALSAAPVVAGPVSGQGTWETTLQARDLNGDSVTDAFYDTVLNITWLRDANVNGRMNWNDAVAWANGLTLGGYSDWRLPTMVDTGAPGCDAGYDCFYNVQTKTGSTVYSEMAHLWYVTLGNLAYCPPGDLASNCGPQAGWGLTNTGDFQNMLGAETDVYWSGLAYAPDSTEAWYFRTYNGLQDSIGKRFTLYAMAVHPGDVATQVPEPESLALVLGGLMAAWVVRRRRPR